MPRRGSMTERSALRRSKEDGDGAAARKARRKSTEQTLARQRTRKQNAEFVVNEKWAPPRRPTTTELGAARKTFYELDKDGSGSIVRWLPLSLSLSLWGLEVAWCRGRVHLTRAISRAHVALVPCMRLCYGRQGTHCMFSLFMGSITN